MCACETLPMAIIIQSSCVFSMQEEVVSQVTGDAVYSLLILGSSVSLQYDIRIAVHFHDTALKV